ncbi:amino acid/polyamine transporter I [Aspergillus germanicus]
MEADEALKKGKGDVPNSDVEDGMIAELGYEQAYRRVFKQTANISLTLATASPLSGILVSSYYQILYGGYFGLVWGWLIPCVLYFPFVISVCELCSSMPLNGATYWWAAALAPPRIARPLSYIAGWLNSFTLVTSLASFAYATGAGLCVVITIIKPELTLSTAEQMGIAMGIVVFWAVLSCLRLEQISFIFICSAAIVLITSTLFYIALPAARAAQGLPFAAAADVFGSYSNYSDWSAAVAVPISFFTCFWTQTGWYGPAFVAEGTHDAPRVSPKSMVTSFMLTAVIGLGVGIVSAFCIPDMDTAAADPSGYALYSMLVENWGQKLAFAFLLVLSINLIFGACSFLVSSSGMVAAFARDQGLPFSRHLAHINPRTSVPLNAMLVLVGGALCLLIFSLSVTARSIIYSLAVIALLLSFSVSVVMRIFTGERFIPGPFYTGRLSLPCHVYSAVFLSWLIVMEAFPTVQHWDRETFNYNWVITVGVLLLCGGFWFVWGYKTFQGIPQESLQAWRERARGERAHERGA